ncbi:hypothetical protein [Fusibacter sp. 3D3]|uniref:hypothetical protein n=1 Tax=Fusibacter sp. 3D3 TaxID=1048380 RepID=UPI000853A467|nr:hypothetical protein [Fusibacter sp. 3D3]GAU75954.1 hypothetical protein F3D3_0550 [Fusibacter sp. 3D3]
MKKSISLVIIVFLLMSQFSFATNSTGDDDYLIKSKIVKGEITAAEAYGGESHVQTYSLNRISPEDATWGQYYIFSTTKVEKYGEALSQNIKIKPV